jgi:hypothetical protein
MSILAFAAVVGYIVGLLIIIHYATKWTNKPTFHDYCSFRSNEEALERYKDCTKHATLEQQLRYNPETSRARVI